MDGGVKNVRYGGLPDSHGLLRHQAGTVTFDGDPSDITLSSHQRWRLHAIHFQYECGAVISTRRLRIEIRSGTTTLQRADAQVTQTANQIRQYTACPITLYSTAFIGTHANIPLPDNLLVAPGQTIRIAVTAGRLDDSITNPTYLIEEWIDG